MKYFIGVDLGTSSLKLLLTDVKGNVINTVSINESETTYNKETSPLEAGIYYIVYNRGDW